MGQAAETLTSASWFYGKDTQALLLMASALGLKDRYTHAHGYRVAEYARRLAIRAHLPMTTVTQIALGGMLHDLGKLALSDKIFSQQSPTLTEDMLREVRNHPLIGAALLRKVTCVNSISDAVLFHHERLDGSGYPFGLKGDEIPLSARIVGIADCFDAVTTDRPYQRRKSCRVATDLLRDGAGVSFEADLVTLFVEEIKTNGVIRPTGMCGILL